MDALQRWVFNLTKCRIIIKVRNTLVSQYHTWVHRTRTNEHLQSQESCTQHSFAIFHVHPLYYLYKVVEMDMSLQLYVKIIIIFFYNIEIKTVSNNYGYIIKIYFY